MAHRIFLSHNWNDKPLVEQVALRLAAIFGQDQVFYDLWSIRPGDGIIDQMNNGLEAPELVFFFVSANSLASGMVKLEWQNALYSATQGKTRLIPVRVDGTEMPAVLKQSVYIDMHTVGLEAAIAEIVSVARGESLFTPQHQTFSNLTCRLMRLDDGSLEVTVSASHMMEPNPNFAFAIMNTNEEVFGWIKGHPGIVAAFQTNYFELNEGGFANAMIMKPLSGALTPKHPLTFELKARAGKAVVLVSVLHDQGQGQWTPVPLAE